MTRKQLAANPVVKLVESLGFLASQQNDRARRHFYWWLPDAEKHGDHEFELREYADGEIAYRVRVIGDYGVTSTSAEDAMRRLKAVGAPR